MEVCPSNKQQQAPEGFRSSGGRAAACMGQGQQGVVRNLLSLATRAAAGVLQGAASHKFWHERRGFPRMEAVHQAGAS